MADALLRVIGAPKTKAIYSSWLASSVLSYVVPVTIPSRFRHHHATLCCHFTFARVCTDELPLHICVEGFGKQRCFRRLRQKGMSKK